MIGFVHARHLRATGNVFIAGVIGLMSLGIAEHIEAAGTPRHAFDVYGQSYRRIDLPPASGGSFITVGDALPDGRILSTTGDGVYLETGVGTGSFELVSTLDTGLFGGTPDPAFLRISPDGSRIALGGGFNKPLAVFNTAELGSAGAPSFIGASNADHFAINHFDAAWLDNNQLAITAGNFGNPAFVSLLDVTSDTLAPVNPVIINNINGASGGITFDTAGRLYTGNGFGSGPPYSDTGWIKIFDPTDWTTATPADFETDGVFLGDILSAGSMSMDTEGNLFVGGGDFTEGQTGYMGVVSAQAITNALNGFGPVDINDPLSLSRLDPIGNGLGFFGSSFNPATGELYVTDGATWWATAPSPGPAAALVIPALGVSWRRKRAA